MSKIEIPEFATWKEEAEFWDRIDTAPLMEDEEGEWLEPGWLRPATGLCRRCGAEMVLKRLDLRLARGRLCLHEVKMLVCPRCQHRELSPDRQELYALREASLQPTGEVTPTKAHLGPKVPVSVAA